MGESEADKDAKLCNALCCGVHDEHRGDIRSSTGLFAGSAGFLGKVCKEKTHFEVIHTEE